MATLKQIRANRLNAQKCTGPSSAEGKTRSFWNALKSGIHAESEVLPWEDPAERDALRAEYHDHHQPRTPEERAMVDNLVHGEFLSRRFRRSEVKIVISKIPAGANLADDATIGQAYSDASGELGRLQRRMDANDRAFHRGLDELRLLKAERPPFETPPPLVLVSSQPEPQPSETADPEPDPPAPSPEPAADVPPATATVSAPAPVDPAPASADPPDSQPNPQPPLWSASQAPVEVLVGLHRIVSALSQNLTPAQVATLNLPQAAALREFPVSTGSEPADSPPPTPAAEPPGPDLSTPQPNETTPQTEQMVSFRQNPEIAPPRPPGFNPLNPHHPPIELCPSCNSMGKIHDRCYFQPREPRK